MGLEGFSGQIERESIQSGLDRRAFDLAGVLDDFVDSAVGLNLHLDIDREALVAEYIDSISDVSDMVESEYDAYKAEVEQFLDATLNELIDHRIDVATGDFDYWFGSMDMLGEMVDLVPERSEEISAIGRNYCHGVFEHTLPTYASASPQDSLMALEQAYGDFAASPYGLARIYQAFGGESREFIEEVKPELNTALESTLDAHVSFMFREQDYLRTIDEEPMLWVEDVQMAIQDAAVVVANLTSLGCTECTEGYIRKVEDADALLTERIATLGEEQTGAADQLYATLMDQDVPRILSDTTMSLDLKLDTLELYLDDIRANRDTFIQDTPPGLLTPQGVLAYNTMADVLILSAMDGIDVTNSTPEDLERADQIFRSGNMTRLFASMQTINEIYGAELFVYSYESRTITPTPLFDELSEADQNEIRRRIEYVGTREDYEDLSETLPQELSDVVSAILMVSEGQYSEAAAVLEGVLAVDAVSLNGAVQNLPQHVQSYMEEQFDTNDFDTLARDLRQQCYGHELTQIQHMINAASARYRASMFTPIRGMYNENFTHSQTLAVHMNALRRGIESGLSWDQAYEGMVQEMSHNNYYGRTVFNQVEGEVEGYATGELPEYRMQHLIPAMHMIFREPDPANRQSMVMNLAEACSDANAISGLGYFGLAETLIGQTHQEELARHREEPSMQKVEHTIRGLFNSERREQIASQIEDGFIDEYGHTLAYHAEQNGMDESRLLMNQVDLVVENAVDDAMQGEIFSYIREELAYEMGEIPVYGRSGVATNRTQPGRVRSDEISDSLLRASTIATDATASYNSIRFWEEMVEPLLTGLIIMVVSLPLGSLSGQWAVAKIGSSLGSIARMSRLGRAARVAHHIHTGMHNPVGHFITHSMVEGFTFNTAYGVTSGVVTGDWSRVDSVSHFSGYGMNSGLVIAAIGLQNPMMRGFSRMIGPSRGFTAVEAVARSAIARSGVIAGEMALLTGVDQLEARLHGVTDRTLAQSVAGSVVTTFALRAMRISSFGHMRQHMSTGFMAQTHGSSPNTYTWQGMGSGHAAPMHASNDIDVDSHDGGHDAGSEDVEYHAGDAHGEEHHGGGEVISPRLRYRPELAMLDLGDSGHHGDEDDSHHGDEHGESHS